MLLGLALYVCASALAFVASAENTIENYITDEDMLVGHRVVDRVLAKIVRIPDAYKDESFKAHWPHWAY